MTTAKPPLNPDAFGPADDDFYAAHEGDLPRPNDLFDADGNRKPLLANDPCQKELRNEWFKFYEKHGGEIEDDEDPPKDKPDTPVQPCPEHDELVLVELIEENDEISPPTRQALSVDRKQWINIGSPHRTESGRFDATGRISLRARVEWKSGRTDGLAGQTVHFAIEPQPGVREGLTWKYTVGFSYDSSLAITETTDAEGWTALASLSLSSYGGDQFRFRATLDGAAKGGIQTSIVTVWRKVFYSVETMRGRDVSDRNLDMDWSRLESIYRDRFIAFERIGTDTKPPYKRMIENSEVEEFTADMPVPNRFQMPHLRFLMCHVVADYDDVLERVITRRVPRSGVFEIVNGVSGRMLNTGDWAIEAHWKKIGRDWAPFPLSNLKLTETAGTKRGFRVYADSSDVPGLGPHRTFKLKIKLRLLDSLGGFQHGTNLAIGSWFDAYRHLDGDSILHVCVHESGHALGLASIDTPEGLPNPYAYKEIGVHCFFGDMDCVMYPGGDYEAHEFCPTCTDCVRARRLTTLHVSGTDGF